MRTETALPFPALRMRWDADLEAPLTDRKWSQALCHAKEISRNMRLRFTQINYLHRTYLTPHRIAKMYAGAGATCPRCGHQDADFIHMVWSCPVIALAWQTMADILSMVVGAPIVLSPESCLLGIRPVSKQNKCKNKLTNLAFALFKRLIAMHWKSQLAPKIDLWLKILLKWTQAESDFLADNKSHGEINAENTRMWNQYVSIIMAKNDDKPP